MLVAGNCFFLESIEFLGSWPDLVKIRTSLIVQAALFSFQNLFIFICLFDLQVTLWDGCELWSHLANGETESQRGRVFEFWGLAPEKAPVGSQSIYHHFLVLESSLWCLGQDTTALSLRAPASFLLPRCFSSLLQLWGVVSMLLPALSPWILHSLLLIHATNTSWELKYCKPGLLLSAGGTEMNKTQATSSSSQIGKLHHQLFLKWWDVWRDRKWECLGVPKKGCQTLSGVSWSASYRCHLSFPKGWVEVSQDTQQQKPVEVGAVCEQCGDKLWELMLELSMDQITQDTEGQARIPGLYLMDSKEPLWDRWWVRCDSKWTMLGTQKTGGNQKAVERTQIWRDREEGEVGMHAKNIQETELMEPGCRLDVGSGRSQGWCSGFQLGWWGPR